jgi:hypothetical protein
MKRSALVLGAAVVAVLAVGACSHTSSNNSKAAGGAGYGASGDVTAQRDLAAVSAPAGVAAGGGQADKSVLSTTKGTAHTAVLAPGDGSAKIRTADMTIAIRGAGNVAAKADAAGAIALRAGGEIDADDRTSGRHASATLELRVPPDQLQAVLRELHGLGTEKSRTLSTVDVTEKVADVTSRVASAQQSIARLRALYANATKVSDVISIESELGSREADLESLQAQQRSLARQTSMAQITVTLQTAAKATAKPAKKPKKTGGFVGGLERGWHGFVTAAAWLASAVGTLLPFLVLAFLVALAGRYAWARVGPRTPRPTPTPTPAE